jgi:curved DNA-binding protein CbpA
MSGAERDPYQVLGLGRGATSADVTRAWRRLARVMHPDSRPGDPAAAAEQFRAVSDAYGLLSDPARRAAWDHQHQDAPARRHAPPGQQAPHGPALWPFPPAATWPAPGPVHGATLRAGPVHIQPPEPADSGGPTAPDPHADAALARLLARLAPPWPEWPW